ncbi:uncharacterized protein LOC127832225 [Dreissena polymorpha]|nr:uncharacterized protein LOC127832225 [Dreissena polymorpha]
MNNFVKTETSSVDSFKVTHYQVIFTFARNATISHIVTININKTASRAGTNWRGSSNYTGAVGGKNDRAYWRRVDCGVRWCGHVCCATTQQPMIAEHHGQSCSTMCVEPNVALEPQVVGGVATPNQKTKMSPGMKNKRQKTSEDDDHEEVLQILRQQNVTLDAILLEQRRTRELLAKLFSFPLNEQ